MVFQTDSVDLLPSTDDYHFQADCVDSTHADSDGLLSLADDFLSQAVDSIFHAGSDLLFQTDFDDLLF